MTRGTTAAASVSAVGLKPPDAHGRRTNLFARNGRIPILLHILAPNLQTTASSLIAEQVRTAGICGVVGSDAIVELSCLADQGIHFFWQQETLVCNGGSRSVYLADVIGPVRVPRLQRAP